MVETIGKELVARKQFLKGDRIETIYLGGGTPSVLSIDQISMLIEIIRNQYFIIEEPEVTIELNPEDVNSHYALGLLRCGINRVSLGIQSFEDQDLAFMNRSHLSHQSHQSLDILYEAGFKNISLDLMFGLIGSDLKSWERNLLKAIDYGPEHISCYNLTIEEQTAFSKWEQTGKIRSIDESIQFDQFMLCHDLLSHNGYDHYEISNYSKPGFRSQHNTNYWQRVPYIGVGPGAHSYYGQSRSYNVSNNSLYLKSNGIPEVHNRETLTAFDEFNEQVMLGLRTKAGLSKELIASFDKSIVEKFYYNLNLLTQYDYIIEEEKNYRLSIQNWYKSDAISSDLFVIPEQ